MNYLQQTDFNNPAEVILKFIESSYNYSKSCPIGPKGDSEECVNSALEIIHYYTYFKYHPYSDHRSGLNTIKDIKEIDFLEEKSKTETLIHTKKNQSTIPACLFTVQYKDHKWRVSEVQIKNGKNKDLYYSVFIKPK